jgi:hypothetical protein
VFYVVLRTFGVRVAGAAPVVPAGSLVKELEHE